MRSVEGGQSCQECGQRLVITSPGMNRMLLVIGGGLLIYAIMIILSQTLKHRFINATVAHASTDNIIGANDNVLGAKYFPNGKISSLMGHAEKGELEIVRRILRSQPNLLTEKGKGGISPLHAALFSKEPTAFETLLNAGFDPNVPADNGITPLMAATFHQDSSYLEAALKKIGKLPVRKDNRGRDALFLAVANRRISNVRLLLTCGADPNGRDIRGNTILMAAFQGRRPDKEIVSLLLSAGAKVDEMNGSGLRAKDFAKTFHDPEFLALLP